MSNIEKQTTNRNASSSAYGWCFQIGAGISLMLDREYLKVFSEVKMEGKSDDIEITLKNGKKIYAQAKSVTQIGYQKNASTNLSNALKVLAEDEQKNGDALKLIYITNISNPLSSKLSSAYTFGNTYDFSVLSPNDQKKITNKAGSNFPADKFQLRIIRFFGSTTDQRFQSIKQQIKEFLHDAEEDPSLSGRLFERWFTILMGNAADKPDKEQKCTLTKKELMFSVIATIIDPPISETKFNKICTYENYDAVKQEFRQMIDINVCDYQLITQILTDYSEKKTAMHKADYKFKFTEEEWKNYEQNFTCITNVEKREAVIKFVLLTIIEKISTIQNIKDAAGLNEVCQVYT